MARLYGSRMIFNRIHLPASTSPVHACVASGCGRAVYNRLLRCAMARLGPVPKID
jgi:hypothetical protein